MDIPKHLFKTQSIHRSISSDINNSILSCGTIHHTHHLKCNENQIFKYYGSLLLLSGEGTYIDADGNETPLYPGCFIQRLPDTLHSTIVKEDGKWLEFFLCFGYDTYVSLQKIGILSTQPVLYPGLSMNLLQEYLNFYRELSAASDEQLPFLLLEAQRIIFTIYQYHQKKTTNPSTRTLLAKSKNLLGGDLIADSSSRGVADHLGMGYENFRKLFKNTYGISPHAYIIQKRMNRAKDLLLQSNMSIQEIAMTIGFPDSYSFSKQFKQQTAITPSDFRNQHNITG